MAWWKKIALIPVGFAVFLAALILAGNWGYADVLFWVSECAVAIGFAVAPFWRRRTSVWYWPTVAILAGINLAILHANRAYIALDHLPSKGAVQGLFLLDCIACWLMMVAVAYLCDRKLPWNK